MAKEKVGVVGAGLMGAEIALVFALAGHEVLLSDTGEAQLSAALERLNRTLDRGVQRGWYKDAEKPLALARITTTVSLDPFARCDFVTEAVFEDEQVRPRSIANSTRYAHRTASSPATPRRSRSRPSPPM
jgi:3-hydroxybutyryl-CoA dehydrogenase